MRLEDIKPCKAYIEATGQEVLGALGFGEISFNAGLIIDEKGRKKYKHGHIAYITFRVYARRNLLNGIRRIDRRHQLI